MILLDIAPRRPLPPHSTCGHVPHLVEARGRLTSDPRLIGKPARAWHVECARCGVATHPQATPVRAETAWRVQAEIVPVTHLTRLRLDAERALAAAA